MKPLPSVSVASYCPLREPSCVASRRSRCIEVPSIRVVRGCQQRNLKFIFVLTCEIKIVHGRFESITSYYTKRHQAPDNSFSCGIANVVPQIRLAVPTQFCDYQELVSKVNSMLPTKRAWWWYDVTDSDLICESLHWRQMIQWTWFGNKETRNTRNRIEESGPPQNGGNCFADSQAGEVWDGGPIHYANAINLTRAKLLHT